MYYFNLFEISRLRGEMRAVYENINKRPFFCSSVSCISLTSFWAENTQNHDLTFCRIKRATQYSFARESTVSKDCASQLNLCAFLRFPSDFFLNMSLDISFALGKMAKSTIITLL